MTWILEWITEEGTAELGSWDIISLSRFVLHKLQIYMSIERGLAVSWGFVNRYRWGRKKIVKSWARLGWRKAIFLCRWGLQTERKSLLGCLTVLWPQLFVLAVIIDFLVADGFQCATGVGTSCPERPVGTVVSTLFFWLSSISWGVACNPSLDSHLEITPHQWMSILRCSVHQEASIKAVPVEGIILPPSHQTCLSYRIRMGSSLTF